jgi:hypothetical protein
MVKSCLGTCADGLFEGVPIGLAIEEAAANLFRFNVEAYNCCAIANGLSRATANVNVKKGQNYRLAESIPIGLDLTERDPSLFVFFVEKYNLRCKADGLSRATANVNVKKVKITPIS